MMPISKTPVNLPEDQQQLIPHDVSASDLKQNISDISYFNNSSNIVLIKPDGFGDTYWGYEVGTQHPLGANAMKGMYSSSQRDGYAIWMKSMSSIWLKDATRSVIIEKRRTVA